MKRYLWELYAEICSWKIWPWRIRNILYAFSGISIGRNTAIHSGCLIIGRHLIIGNGSYINSDCMFESSNAFIEVGDCVGIAYNCNFYTTHHEYSNPTKRTGRVIGKTIKIGDGVWIGGGGNSLSGCYYWKRLYYSCRIRSYP